MAQPPTPPAQPPQPDPGPAEEKHVSDELGRRRFLNTTWKVLGAALVVEAGWTSYDILNPQSSGAFGGVVAAGPASEYREGTVKYFQDGRFYVTASSNELVALYQKCPHLGCRVPFCDSSGRFECPCHGSKYNLRGEYIEGPAPHGMDRFPLRIHGGQVFVDTATPVTGPARGVSTVSNVPKGPSCVGGASASGAGALERPGRPRGSPEESV